MKTLKKLGTVLLVGAMLFSLAACGKSAKKISSKEFKETLEKEEYSVVDLGADEDSKIQEQLLATSKDESIICTYYTFTDTDTATKFFDESYNQMKEAEKMDTFTGSVSKSGTKYTVNATVEEDGEKEETYMVCVRSGEMVIAVMTESVANDSVKAVDSVVNKLCY